MLTPLQLFSLFLHNEIYNTSRIRRHKNATNQERHIRIGPASHQLFDQWEKEARARNVSELPAGAKMAEETTDIHMIDVTSRNNCFKNNAWIVT